MNRTAMTRAHRPVTGGGAFVAWLALVWVALWGEVTAGNVLGGLVVGTGLLVAFRGAGPYRLRVVRPLQTLVFLGYFIRELVESNVVVAREVVSRRNRIREGIIEVALPHTTPTIATVVANAITLTPGTLTLEAVAEDRSARLYVHVLHLHDVESVRGGLEHLHYRAARAFGDDALVRALDEHRRRTGHAEEGAGA
ncbi:MAG: Na+/H+ antiporter subunit E [Actinomycetota bacterium]|nr:Na+/H+ antiporter subunit E [Actinomycetota bacterium]